MRCPACGAAGAKENRFCLKCGKPIAGEGGALLSGATGPEMQTVVAAATAFSSAAMDVVGRIERSVKPSGLVPPFGVALLLVMMLLSPVVVGACYHLLARTIDLFLVFPLLVGLITGCLMVFAARRGKCRNPRLLFCCAIVAGLLTYPARLFFDSLESREQVIASYSRLLAAGPPGVRPGNPGRLTRAAAETAIRQRVTPLLYFGYYLQDSAQAGTVLSDVGASSSSTDLSFKGHGFYALLIFNGLLIAGAAAMAGFSVASVPFCETCDRWFGSPAVINKVHPSRSDEMVGLAQVGDWKGVGSMGGEGVDDKNHCDVSLISCPGCRQTRLRIFTARGARLKTLFDSFVTPEAAAAVKEGRAQRL